MANSMYKGIFSSDKSYPSLSVVTYNDLNTESSVAVQVLMISTQAVPVGSDIKDANYWLPYNVENVNMLGAKAGITYDEVAKMIEESETDIRADITDLKSRVTTLEQEQEALSGTVEQHETKLTTVEDNVENLDTEMATAQADIAELKAKPDYVLPKATDTTLGGVIIGSGITVDEFGRISAQSYSLPTASGDVLGGIKVGENLSIDESGVLSASGGSVTVDDYISSVSENPVQNKVIEKYLEPVMGKPQESEVPTVNLTGDKYPINTLTNENGVIFSWVTSNTEGSIQNYFEYVLDFDVSGLGLKLGFWKSPTTGQVTPFVFYNSYANDSAEQAVLYKYDTSGVLVSTTKLMYKMTWDGSDFILTDATYQCTLNLSFETFSDSYFPCIASGMNRISSNVIGDTVTHLFVISGDIQLGKVAYGSDAARFNVVKYTEPHPVFEKWWSDCNVTYNGSTATTPWEQIQKDVDALKSKPDYVLPYTIIEIPDVTALSDTGDITGSVTNVSSGSAYIVRSGNVISVYFLNISNTSLDANGIVTFSLSETKIKELLGISDITQPFTWSVELVRPRLQTSAVAKPYDIQGWYGITAQVAGIIYDEQAMTISTFTFINSTGGDSDSQTETVCSATGVLLNGVAVG